MRLVSIAFTLDAGDRSRVVSIGGSAEASLANLVITGGTALCGGGIYVASGSTLSLGQSVMTQNHSDSCGGAIFAEDGSAVSASETTFEDNYTSSIGGAIYAGQGAKVNLVDTSVVRNRAMRGGGISSRARLWLKSRL